ncbi:MAG: tRNA uridine-5-carboxymethylaminomethyl(34) synthesis GTPase MnmE [Chlorobi bacterium]|nr:tRNA uridine-5-carboxymethylaminomethyl(34) synthesis GTPase MnmE [Chlorobiota bacterium]
MDFRDTICAVSTPPGLGAIAMVRLSGDRAIDIADSLIRFPGKGKPLKTLSPNVLRFAYLSDNMGLIDDVMVSVYHAPHSYTGEDVVEITCHGSAYIQQRIMLALIHAGARTAAPGEFTQRAFLHGKMDLAQAEAVGDLIAAENAAAHRLALTQMRGQVSEKIKTLRSELVDMASLIELELDFSEEDVEFADRNSLMDLAGEILHTLESLTGSFRQGNVMKNGIPVAIIGEPNVGKSTLLNALLQEDRAIVSEIPGTTRDFIEDTITISGFMFRFIDTAGLRASKDKVEKIGIDRTYRKIKEASLILLVTDINSNPESVQTRVNEIQSLLKDDEQHLVVVVNKTDKLTGSRKDETGRRWHETFDHVILISALREKNLEELRERLVKIPALKQPGDQEIIISNMRHYEALSHAAEAIRRTINGLNEGLSNDLVAQDLREAIHFIGEITGEITTDDILGNIFSKFCIGK